MKRDKHGGSTGRHGHSGNAAYASSTARGAVCYFHYSRSCGRNGPQRSLLHAYVEKSQRLSEGLERGHLGKIPGNEKRKGKESTIDVLNKGMLKHIIKVT